MKSKQLANALVRVEDWPQHVQDELAWIALDMNAGLKDDEYESTPEERAGIDRGLRAADEGRLATPAQVEAAFAKFRPRRPWDEEE